MTQVIRPHCEDTVVVLLSIGRHPVSGEPRMAHSDRQALELALRSGQPVVAVHAGPGQIDVLRAYLGMGLAALRHLETSADVDVIEPLLTTIEAIGPRLVLCGRRSEAGWASGTLPYRLAARLHWPMLSAVTAFAADGNTLTVTQAVAGGRRRQRVGPAPAVLAVADQAAPPRLSAFARQRAGVIDIARQGLEMPVQHEAFPETQPARRRAVRLRPSRETAPTERRVLTDLDADAAAREVLDYFVRCGLLDAALPAATTSSANGKQDV